MGGEITMDKYARRVGLLIAEFSQHTTYKEDNGMEVIDMKAGESIRMKDVKSPTVFLRCKDDTKCFRAGVYGVILSFCYEDGADVEFCPGMMAVRPKGDYSGEVMYFRKNNEGTLILQSHFPDGCIVKIYRIGLQREFEDREKHGEPPLAGMDLLRQLVVDLRWYTQTGYLLSSWKEQAKETAKKEKEEAAKKVAEKAA